MTDFSERLRKAIDQSGMSQRQLAERVDTTEVSISRYVRGERVPRANVLDKLSEVLNVPVSYFFSYDDEKPVGHIELIDKYIVRQTVGDYNPPSYIWSDNTGELIRCGNCRYADGDHRRCTCPGGLTGELEELGYCYKGAKRE